VGLAWIALLLLAYPLAAQYQAPSEKLLISGKSAFTWSDKGTDVVQILGPVTISLDRATLTANDAIVWLTPAPDGAPGQQHADFALLGNAVLDQPGVGKRTGDRLLVTAEVQGDVRIVADQRVAKDMSDTPLYHQGESLRAQAVTMPAIVPSVAEANASSKPASRPARRPATGPAALPIPVHLEAGQTDVVDTADDTLALVAWNGVKIFARQPTGDMIELQAQRAVLFTSLHSLRDIQKEDKSKAARDKVVAVYLEGDARIEYDSSKPGVSEQRLMGEHIYYEFATDRAILLDAVLHTVDLKQNVPFIVRANVLRQLSKGEYTADKVEITSSAFSVPSYSLAADRMYVRQEATGDPLYPSVEKFEATSVTLRTFGIPFFYLPFVAGSVGDRPGALRGIGFGHRSDLGYSLLTEWGLFETLGKIPPRDIDADYRIDYFTDRGPGFGINAAYGGGFLTEPSHQAWNFLGDIKSYFIYDKGTDNNLGRLPVKPDGSGYDLRGRVNYEHQHFFPDDWQAQIRLGYVSDPTFLEEWFPLQFYQDLPTDVSGYIKHQRDTEAFTLLAEVQPNRRVTTSDRVAEQFEVEKTPEIGYHRIGDGFANDSLTFFSDNTAGGYDFAPQHATLQQQGFIPKTLLPGIPALGLTGINTQTTWRSDLRQEIDLPVNAGRFKVVPYVVGRYTQYSTSPGSGDEQHRFFGAVGTRMTTSFWNTDPTAQSDLFDIHQLRHVVEPEANLFSSVTSVDRSRLFQYDMNVDSINDISVAQIGLRQRWQTQRGGPGRWRSVDVFTLDLDAEFYANKPNRKFLQPFDFRGMYFSSLPETSIPRDAANVNASWRLTDNTVLLGNAQYNIDESKLATAAAGILVRRDVQESWFIGNQYIADLHSNIVSIAANYVISPKYSLGFNQSFDFGLGKDVSSSVSVVRNFDRFFMSFSFSHDAISNQTGFNFSIAPMGFGQSLGSSALQGPFKK
jgi:hypothetical protein